MKLIQKFLSLGKKARGDITDTSKPLFLKDPVDKIIIHWIGPYTNQLVNSPWEWWENGSDKTGVQASAHFIVKGEDVLQALPMNEVGWHSGDARNWNSIGIEVIPINTEGEFDEKTIDTLKELIAYIRTVYPNTKLERHADGTQKKNCPNWYTWYTPGGEERWIILRNYLNGVDDD